MNRYYKQVAKVMAPFWEARINQGFNPPKPDEIGLHTRILSLAGQADKELGDLLNLLIRKQEIDEELDLDENTDEGLDSFEEDSD